MAAVGCGTKDAPPPPEVQLTPALEARFAALGAECKHLMRMGNPEAPPRVFQCQGTTAYVSINSFEGGQVKSIELALTGPAKDVRAGYASTLGPLIPAETLEAIQSRFPDGGNGIDPPALATVGGLRLMISADKKPTGIRGDVTITW